MVMIEGHLNCGQRDDAEESRYVSKRIWHRRRHLEDWRWRRLTLEGAEPGRGVPDDNVHPAAETIGGPRRVETTS